jgi:integrase
MDKMGIHHLKGKYGPHIFRHSAGTFHKVKSRDLKLGQGTLRHKDILTTSNIYVHPGDEILNEGSEILTTERLATCDLFVTQVSETVS